MAFLLGFPANEIVIPIMLMAYMAQGSLTDYDSLSQLHQILLDNGWTWQTALSTMLLCLFHFPCGTTCLTIKKRNRQLEVDGGCHRTSYADRYGSLYFAECGVRGGAVTGPAENPLCILQRQYVKIVSVKIRGENSYEK